MKDIKEKTWEEFRKTGLLLFVNQILHIFGWAIVCEIDNGITIKVYPARVKFRGFSENSTKIAYEEITKYMVDNDEELLIEILP